MIRKVFYSFHYQKDISRVMIVRNRWVTFGGQKVSGVIDKADFEKLMRTNEKNIKNWIDAQLKDTSATVVLIGAETLKRRFVQYEICQSINKGNAVIGVYIHNLKDFSQNISTACDVHTCIGYDNNIPIYFDDIAPIYDYYFDDGYTNLNKWVDDAVSKL